MTGSARSQNTHSAPVLSSLSRTLWRNSSLSHEALTSSSLKKSHISSTVAFSNTVRERYSVPP